MTTWLRRLVRWCCILMTFYLYFLSQHVPLPEGILFLFLTLCNTLGVYRGALRCTLIQCKEQGSAAKNHFRSQLSHHDGFRVILRLSEKACLTEPLYASTCSIPSGSMSHALAAAHCLLPQLWVRQVIDWTFTELGWTCFMKPSVGRLCVNPCEIYDWIA